MRWALETAGVSAPPRTITSTAWQLLRKRQGENGHTPEQCLTWLLFQFPSVFQMTLDDGVVIRATNVSYRLQKANGACQLKLAAIKVSDPTALNRDLADYAKRPRKAPALDRPTPRKGAGKGRAKTLKGRPRSRPAINASLTKPLVKPFHQDAE